MEVRGRLPGELDVPDHGRPNGRYGGVNTVAVAALVLGVLPNVPGFLMQAEFVERVPGLFAAIHPFAWFTGVLIAGGLSWAGMRGRPKAVIASP